MGEGTPIGVQDQRPCLFRGVLGCNDAAGTNPMGTCAAHWQRMSPERKRWALRVGAQRLLAHEVAKWGAQRTGRRWWR